MTAAAPVSVAAPTAATPATTAAAAPGASISTGGDVALSFQGLRFPNSFPDARYMGIAFPGACGGMSYAALDYHYAHEPPPSITTTPAVDTVLGAYVRQRQWESVVGAGGHGARFAALLANPDDAALTTYTTTKAWPEVRGFLDAGMSIPVGLIPSPWAFFANAPSAHQVVAVGYSDQPGQPVGEGFGQAGTKILRVWDPNHGLTTLTLGTDGRWHGDPKAGAGGEVWRAFFVESGYTPRQPPAAATALEKAPPSVPLELQPLPGSVQQGVQRVADLFARTAALTASTTEPLRVAAAVGVKHLREVHPLAYVGAGLGLLILGGVAYDLAKKAVVRKVAPGWAGVAGMPEASDVTPAVAEVVRDRFGSSRAVRLDYDGDATSLDLGGEVLPLQLIAMGGFTRAFTSAARPGRVFAVVPEDVHDKDVAAEAHDAHPNNPHLPATTPLGRTPDGYQVYEMPKYRALRRGDSGYSDWLTIDRCADRVARDLDAGATPREVSDFVLACVEGRVRPAVAEALRMLLTAGRRRESDYGVDLYSKNFAADDQGRLVLLDVLSGEGSKRKT